MNQDIAQSSTNELQHRDGVGPVVELARVLFSWPGERFRLSIEAFEVQRGERLLLIGPSGGGKSTLLSLIAGVIVPQRGHVRDLDQELTLMSSAGRDRFRAEHIGVIFQMFNLLPYGSVLDNVLLPLSFAPMRRTRVITEGSERTEARRLLSALGLSEDLFDGPSTALSVGQQQRVAAARALIGAPEIIIADEPTSALDDAAQERFVTLLFEQLSAAHATLIMVSHDERLTPKFDRVCYLADVINTGPAA